MKNIIIILAKVAKTIIALINSYLDREVNYYLNPLHRSKTKAEAKREVALFNDQLVGRTSTQILSDMLLKLHQDKGLECVFNHHIKFT